MDWAEYRAALIDAGSQWCIVAHRLPMLPYTLTRWHAYLDYACAYRYSLGEILLCAVDGIVGWGVGHDVVWARRLGNMIASRVICSRLACEAYGRIGWLPPYAVDWTPDDLWDHQCPCLPHPPSRDWCVRVQSAGW